VKALCLLVVCPSGCPSIVPFHVMWCLRWFSIRIGGTSAKFATNVHYVTGRCSNGIEDQRSKVKVLTKRINPWWRMHTSWQCGIEAHLLSPTFMLTMLCLCWCISDAVKWMQHWLSEVETMQKFSHATSSWKTANGVFKILSEEIALCLCHWQMYLRLRDTP